MISSASYTIVPLGETSITIDFGNVIDESINKQVLSIFNYLRSNPIDGMIEASPAYSSVTVYYDPVVVKKCAGHQTGFEYLSNKLSGLVGGIAAQNHFPEKLVRIPVCYDKEFGLDIEHVAKTKKISVEEIIHQHTSNTYRVFMLGFLPGFPYMGEVNDKLVMPRRDEPRIKVDAGSVGIAGKQTGVYPLDCPGGWQIIGRTPVKMFNPNSDTPTLLNAGNKVQFYSISRDEFENYQGGTS